MSVNALCLFFFHSDRISSADNHEKQEVEARACLNKQLALLKE